MIVGYHNPVRIKGLWHHLARTLGRFQYFAELARRRDQLTRGYLPTDGGELSMGTSGDYLDALAHGATWVRVGTALLGARLASTNSVQKESQKSTSLGQATARLKMATHTDSVSGYEP